MDKPFEVDKYVEVVNATGPYGYRIYSGIDNGYSGQVIECYDEGCTVNFTMTDNGNSIDFNTRIANEHLKITNRHTRLNPSLSGTLEDFVM